MTWGCVCECGKTTKTATYDLLAGKSKSCGCVGIEKVGKLNLKHGLSKTKEYAAWTNIRDRCYNKNNKHFYLYGGTGIKVCDRWINSFEDFLSDMGKAPTPNHSIDRYPNNSGNYEPLNCRWATTLEQNRNQRSNKWLEYDGVKKMQTDWAVLLNANQSEVSRMLKTKNIGDIIMYYSKKHKVDYMAIARIN